MKLTMVQALQRSHRLHFQQKALLLKGSASSSAEKANPPSPLHNSTSPGIIPPALINDRLWLVIPALYPTNSVYLMAAQAFILSLRYSNHTFLLKADKVDGNRFTWRRINVGHQCSF
ncbi:hypothetical protein ACQK5W_02320 [Pantoea sp. FN060301]|uniref:hypothetical protein n=1 Tax=Pantoea sp. FN060301 TaxID=3420380 RepID=UPI003D163AE0